MAEIIGYVIKWALLAGVFMAFLAAAVIFAVMAVLAVMAGRLFFGFLCCIAAVFSAMAACFVVVKCIRF